MGEIITEDVHDAANVRIIQRLTALWGLTEAGLGGVVHALKIPFTGIVVGSTAIILITLIAYFARRKPSVLLRSMIVVLVIKAGVSPHTPVPAYFAVLFQGCLAAFLFRILPGIRLPAMILGILALIEGVFQKFLIMTVLYGKSVWEAIDLIGQKLSVQWGLNTELQHASLWLIGVFALYYGVGGIVVGWLAGRIPFRVEAMLQKYREQSPSLCACGAETDLPEKARRKWPLRRLMPAVLILLMILIVYGGLHSDGQFKLKGLYVLVRAVVVLLVWFCLAGPLIRKLINRFRKRESIIYGDDLNLAMNIMPQLRKMASLAWSETAKENKFVRWYRFLLLLVVYSIICDE